MTPDEIQKDRAAGTPGELAERLIRIKDGITHRADRDALSNAVNLLYALTAENAALKARVAELEEALHPFSKTAGEMFSRNWEKDDVALKFVTKGKAFIVTFSDFLNARAALEKSHE